MRRTLLMIAAVALLLTQCRKPAVELPTAGPANENMVSMTVTVGHGGKTEITGTGAITWSAGDKLYVGDGSKYIGCLTLVGDGGSATGTFTGSVSTTSSTTFGFYYLGSRDYTTGPSALTPGTSETATVSFASQTGLIGDLSDCHIGYGTATGKVDGTSVILDNPTPVTMTSKVAIAYFEFKDGKTPYTGAITLSGTNICSSMTVGFDGSFAGTTGTSGNAISLTNTSSSDKYVMLVPTGTGEETLEFGGGAEGTTTLYKGIEANKFYCVGAGEPIAVSVKPTPKFTVKASGSGTTVEFSQGNLWYGIAAGESTSAFHFEANQWDYSVGDFYEDEEEIVYNWDPSHVSHFFWSNTTDWQESGKEPYAASYSYSTRTTEDVFFTNATETTANPNFHVNGETGENQWRTLSIEEWEYLFYSRDNASDLWAWVTLTDVSVLGLVILPDGSTVIPSSVTTTALVASSGAVFLPAAGDRLGTDVSYVGSSGYYWSSTPNEDYEARAYYMLFSGSVFSNYDGRLLGSAVRLVRDIPNASVNGSANNFNGGMW